MEDTILEKDQDSDKKKEKERVITLSGRDIPSYFEEFLKNPIPGSGVLIEEVIKVLEDAFEESRDHLDKEFPAYAVRLEYLEEMNSLFEINVDPQSDLIRKQARRVVKPILLKAGEEALRMANTFKENTERRKGWK